MLFLASPLTPSDHEYQIRLDTGVVSLYLGEADDSAGDARTRVAGGLAELVAAHSQVIRVGVNDQSAPDDAVRTH